MFRRLRDHVFLAAAFVALLIATSIPGLLDHVGLVEVALAGAVAIGALVYASPVLRYRRQRAPAAGPSLAQRLKSVGEMAAQLSPIVLLTLIFPIAAHRLGATRLYGVRMTTLLLASSLTVPWLSQSVCVPLYRAMSTYAVANPRERAQRFWAVWPCVLTHALPLVALFAGTVELVTRWPLGAFGVYVGLCVAHVAFAQALVVANIERRRLRWAIAWSVYAAALFLLPKLWYLPPVAGTLTQLIPIRQHAAQLLRPIYLDRVEVWSDLLRGLLLGAVLWADKWLFFLRDGDHFAVNTVFFALLPAVLAYNYYFVRLSPGFDASVTNFRKAMENEAFSVMPNRSATMMKSVTNSVQRTGFVGAVLVCALALQVAEHSPDNVRLAVPVAIASWMFMMITVLSYKLDYVGRRSSAQAIGAAHLVICGVLFAAMTPGPALYTTLAGCELVLFVAAFRLCVTHWRTPEYTLFWRHATAW